MDRVVAALGRADGVGAARIVRRRRQRVVLALAVGPADRVDRREVEHVEAHVADVGQLARSRRRRCRGGSGSSVMRAREQLVPGGEAAPRPVDDHLELAVVADSVGAAAAAHQRRALGSASMRRAASRDRRSLVQAGDQCRSASLSAPLPARGTGTARRFRPSTSSTPMSNAGCVLLAGPRHASSRNGRARRRS